MPKTKKKPNVIDTNKIKHLEFIQDMIERMYRNSTLLKGWCLTVIFALMTFSKNVMGMDGKILIFVIISFYLLDTHSIYYQESFIDLFNKVRKQKGTDFSLKIHMTKKAFVQSILHFPNIFFYLFLAVVIISIYAPEYLSTLLGF